MAKRIFIIHGYGGSPDIGWFRDLRKGLTQKGFKVFAPHMPETASMDAWVSTLSKAVGKPDENTYFIGYSLGTQTVLRYLESLPEKIKVGKILLIAPFVKLSENVIKSEYESSEDLLAWTKKPINWNKILMHTKDFTSYFGKDDPVVPIENSKIFKDKLKSKIIVYEDMEHFDEITEEIMIEWLKVME